MASVDGNVAQFVYDEIAKSEDRLASAIGLAARMTTANLRQNPPGVNLSYGTVTNAGPPANVELDVDRSTIQAYSLGPVTAGQRVAVLTIPPSGALILGAPLPPDPQTDWQAFLNTTDPDALRLLATANQDAAVRVERLICTIREASGSGLLTAAIDVPTVYALNVPNLGELGAKRADPTAGNYELISAGADDSVQVGKTDFPGQVVRVWGQIDTSLAKGVIDPKMTTAQRDALTGQTDGMRIYNTQVNAPQQRIAGVWTSLGAGGGGGTGTANWSDLNWVLLDSFAGANDDAKLTAALAYAADPARTYTPVIRFSGRKYTFTVNNRQPFNGMVLAGPGDGKYNTASGATPNRTMEINLNFDSSASGIGWFHNIGGNNGAKTVTFTDLCFVGGANATFLTNNATSTWLQLLVRNITASGLRSVIGSPAQRLLMTACIFDGNWDINNGWNTSIYVGGSDCSLWDGGQMLIDSPGTPDGGSHEPAGNGVPHIRIGFLDKSVIGRIYATCAGKWYAMLVEGQAYNSGSAGGNSGPVHIKQLIAEGRNKDTPCYGAVVRVTGGQPVFDTPWFGYGMTAPATQGLAALGLIHCTSGMTRIESPTYGNATGVSQTTVPMCYATGAGTRVRLRNGAIGSQAGAWADPRPRTQAAATASVDIDNSFIAI